MEGAPHESEMIDFVEIIQKKNIIYNYDKTRI